MSNLKVGKILILGFYDYGKFLFDRSISQGDIFIDPLGNLYKIITAKENAITHTKLANVHNSIISCTVVSRENFLTETGTSEYTAA